MLSARSASVCASAKRADFPLAERRPLESLALKKGVILRAEAEGSREEWQGYRRPAQDPSCFASRSVGMTSEPAYRGAREETSEVSTKEGAFDTCKDDTGSFTEYFNKHHNARTPSFHPIFLPSS